ncbi:MAG: hypothetical protein M1818_003973 [Claussenomyces sp. TS43310]|nr:MAG: hypothetical protein M1818_003973 [Claussenomyces sp. TS43310]
MSEFIGYVGTLHEIDSNSSTVALENVTSFGTEGRKENSEEEIPPSDSVYEYIVFRGSDVKDLRIEEAPAPKENKPPQVPNDPAILGSGSRPAQSQPAPRRPNQPQQPQQPQQQQGPPPPQFPQNSQYPPHFYPPPPTQWGRGGPGYPGMPPYGAPPAWMPPPGQGFPQPGPFPYGPYGPYPPGPHPGPPVQQQPQTKPSPIGPGGSRQQGLSGDSSVHKTAEPKETSKTEQPAAELSSNAPTPPLDSKPASAETQQAASQSAAAAATVITAKPAPVGPKNGRIVPALPLQSPAITKAPLQGNATNASRGAISQPSAAANRAAVADATQAATAAVAAAMAKLTPLPGQQNGGNAVDNLTKKVNEMRTNEPIRAPRQPGAEGFSGRGGREGQRGRGRSGPRQETRKVEVPKTDFDFESSNAKFNKDDLVKEAIAGSPLHEKAPSADDSEVSNSVTGSYNKASSFFDDLSSEIKDRAEGTGQRLGGREWRGEEQKKNLETFGQGSVDNGYGGGNRGRGRGRGGRGRGYGGNRQSASRGRGHRGSRGETQTFAS